MKQALALCSLALNPSSPSPTATSVKVEDGFMSSYGGLFTIRTPCKHEIGAVFNPRALSTFFRKPRTKIAYTLKFPKLTISDGNERLTIGCLKPEEMAVIDNIETPLPCSLNLKMLKIAAELCAVEGKPYALGVTFREGMMMSTNNDVFFCGQSDLPEDFDFFIHKNSCVALTKFKGSVVAVSKNNHTVKFIFDDGSSLCSHTQDDRIPDVAMLFEGQWSDFKITEDILALDCDHIEVRQDNLYYYSERTHGKVDIGELENVVKGSPALQFKVNKKHFNHLLGGDLSWCGTRLQSIKDNSALICRVML